MKEHIRWVSAACFERIAGCQGAQRADQLSEGDLVIVGGKNQKLTKVSHLQELALELLIAPAFSLLHKYNISLWESLCTLAVPFFMGSMLVATPRILPPCANRVWT